MITFCFIYALRSAPPSLETRFYAAGSATNQTEPVMGLGHDWCGCSGVGLAERSHRLLVGRVAAPSSPSRGTVMTKQSAVVETSQGLFKEWVTTETPGRLPQGHVVLLGQLSGRPVGLVCVRVHLCFAGRLIKGRRWLAGWL